MYLILLWALVALIGRVHCKCSLAPIVDDERSIAYACVHGDLNDLDEISSETKWIEFSVSRFHHIPSNAFSRFKDLRRLSFYNCHISAISADAFADLDRLDWLIFHGTKIHVVLATWFRHLPNLRRLVLDRCGIEHFEADVFRMLPRLETLGLRDNDLDCLPIEELSYLRSLKTVRIDGNPWLCECRQRMDKFFKDRSIIQEEECAREIGIYRNVQCMAEIGIPILPSSLTTQYLSTFEKERAEFRGNEFETTVLSSLDRLPDRTTWIEIKGLRIDKIPQYTFFRFGNSLQSLDLNDCMISTIETNAFAGLHKLQRLSLVGNRFPAVGADWFFDLVGLQQLILQRNDIERIENSAFRHVGESLRHLDIRNNRLRCLPLEELEVLRKLERLDATGNPWTCTCRRELESFLTYKSVGFEISGQPCYETENEIPEVTDGWRQYQTTEGSTPATGRVQWSSFQETVREMNTTIVRPVATPPTIHVHVETPQPPVYKGTCYPDKTYKSDEVYICSGITSIEELNAIPSTVRTIHVILSNLRKVPANSFARFNGYLSSLELRDCGIEEIEYRAFDGLYNLQQLSLHSNQLNSINSNMFEGLTNLRRLNLSHNHISNITKDTFDALPYLTDLDISDNSMNCVNVQYMAHRLRYLKVLKVSDNPWTCLCGTMLANFLDDRRIPYDKISLLDMNDECYVPRPSATSTTTSRTTVGVIIPMVTTPAIKETIETIEGYCDSDQTATGLRYRCTGGNLLLLQTIPANVTAIEFHKGHLPHLSAGYFSKFSNLRELVIVNSGLKVIEQGTFDGLDRLENLTIQDNPLDTIGPSCFVSQNLKRLDLRGNSIKYIAPGAFRHLNQLSYLNLEGNDLKCIFTSDLNDLPNLYLVEFFGNPLKWRCRVELEQFLETHNIKFTKIENACEGKKLVKKLIYQNRTDGEMECVPECSAATIISGGSFLFILSGLTCSILTAN